MIFPCFQEGNTAIHLAAKHGHTQVLDALKGHVTWDITSTKVNYTKFNSIMSCTKSCTKSEACNWY